MLVCVNRNASAWPVIQRERHYCVNILDSRHQHLADRFAGRDGVKGAARYEGARWRQFATGAWGLEDALAVVDCAVEEIIERHSHGIIIGSAQWVHLGGGDRGFSLRAWPLSHSETRPDQARPGTRHERQCRPSDRARRKNRRASSSIQTRAVSRPMKKRWPSPASSPPNSRRTRRSETASVACRSRSSIASPARASGGSPCPKPMAERASPSLR